VKGSCIFMDTVRVEQTTNEGRPALLEAHKDRALLEAVRNHLMKDQRLSGQSINVTASGGFIQITGVVDTEEQKQLALDMARGFIGVRTVEDHIKVR